MFLFTFLQTSATPVLVQVLSLTWQKELQSHLLTQVKLISIFTQTTDLLVFWILVFWILVFLKIIESSIFDQLTTHANEFLQNFAGAYRKLYSSQHSLIRLIEKWKTQLNKNKIVGELERCYLIFLKPLTAYPIIF